LEGGSIPVYLKLPIAENYPPVCHNQRSGGNRCNLVDSRKGGKPKKQGGKTQKNKKLAPVFASSKARVSLLSLTK
jgi:hypothetical protein